MILDNLIICYMIAKKYVANKYNYFLIKFIGLSELKILIGSKIINVWHKFLIYEFLTKLILWTDLIKNKVILLRSKIDVDADKVHLIRMSENGNRSIIIDKNYSKEKGKIDFSNIKTNMNNVIINDDMIKCFLMEFFLEDSGNDKICLKSFIIKYKDLDGTYDNTLKNILIFNNIDFNDDNILHIKIFKNGKGVSHNFKLFDVGDNHVNFFLNL